MKNFKTLYDYFNTGRSVTFKPAVKANYKE